MTKFTQATSINEATDTLDSAAPRLEIKRFYVKEQLAKYRMLQTFLMQKGVLHSSRN